MKSFIILAMACTAALGISTAGFAAEPSGGSDAKGATKATLAPAEIKGEILKIDGDIFVVKDERSKSEVKFTIEKDVRASLERPLKQGDRIEASLTPEGYAKTIRFEGAKNQGGMKSPEGGNPTLSPGGKGSAGGG